MAQWVIITNVNERGIIFSILSKNLTNYRNRQYFRVYFDRIAIFSPTDKAKVVSTFSSIKNSPFVSPYIYHCFIQMRGTESVVARLRFVEHGTGCVCHIHDPCLFNIDILPLTAVIIFSNSVAPPSWTRPLCIRTTSISEFD